MKKLLALVLALVMSMSLVTISNAAFADADDIDYTEAVEVMNAVGVLSGGDGNKFNPKAELTRAQACKIIAYLDLGEDIAEALPALQVFSDVPANNWAAKYVAYCADAGYVSGVGGGKFDPDAKVTGYQFGKMLLCVLGYDAEYEQFTGSSWEINVAKKMKQLDLADGVEKAGSLALTREEAAQYALNALETVTVTANKGTTTKVEGVTVVTGGSAATKNEDIAGTSYTAVADDYLQLTEQLYGKHLIVRVETNKAGRTVNTWYYNAKGDAQDDDDYKVGSYVTDSSAKTIIATKDGKSLQYWLETVDTDWVVPTSDSTHTAPQYNGAASSSSDIQLGAEILVFVDDDDADDVTKVIVNTYDLEEITKVTKVSGKTYDYTVKVGSKSYTDEKLPGFDATTMVEDSYVLVLFGSDNSVLEIKTPKSVTGVKTAAGSDYIKIDGVKYTCVSDGSANYKDTYEFYLDNNGYVVGKKLVETAATSDGYVYVIDFDAQKYNGGEGLIGGNTAADALVKVKVAYMDGTQATLNMPVVKATSAVAGTAVDGSSTIAKDHYYVTFCGDKYEVNTDVLGKDSTTGKDADAIKGKFYNYTLNDAGEITLKKLDTDTEKQTTAGANLKKDSIALNGTYSANSKTVLTTIGTSSKSSATYTGYTNFPSTAVTSGAAILVIVDKDSTIANKVFAVVTDVTAESVTYAWYAGDKETQDGDYFAEFYVDGKTETYEVDGTTYSALAKNTIYELEYVSADKTWKTESVTNVKGLVKETDDNFFKTGDKTAAYADDVAVWDLTGDDVVAGDISVDDSVVYAEKTVDGKTKVAVAYIVKSFVTEQPKTENAAKEIIDDATYNAVAPAISLELTQSIDGNTIYLGGELDKLSAEDDAAIRAFDSFLADFAALATSPAPYDEFESDNFAFVLVEVDGNGLIFIVGENADGEVIGKDGETSFTKTLGGISVKIDLTGLSF